MVDGFLFYVMPFVEGESLRERLAREGRLPMVEAIRIVRNVADALGHAHSRGIVHRDIKPENVMISGRHALVMDFGVSRAVSEAAGRAKLTTAGMAIGTPAYMAPEQALADPSVGPVAPRVVREVKKKEDPPLRGQCAGLMGSGLARTGRPLRCGRPVPRQRPSAQPPSSRSQSR